MGTDDDIALSLPEPPPPRPARRDAAIEEAMRRFDGEPPRERPKAPRRWAGVSRPQMGLLVSAALIAVIGLPVALTSINQRVAPAARETPAPATVAAPTPPAAVAKVEPAPAAPPPAKLAVSTASPTAPAMTVARDDLAAPAPTPAPVAAPPPPPPPPPPQAPPAPEPAPVVSAFAARQEQEAVSMRRAELRQSPAVSAPAAKATAGRAAASEDSADIMVTGSAIRAPVRRGDWNACTVNDPTRRLDGCKRLVDPGAKGPAGQAAARLADGLSSAWRGDYDKAIDAFDQAIALQPRLAFAYLNRGLAWQRRGEIDRAIADLDNAVRYDANARGYYNRSVALRQRGDTRRANLDADRAIELDSRYETVTRR